MNQMGLDIKIFRMNRLGIPQDRMAKRLGMDQKTIHNHLGKMAALPNFLNGTLRVTFRLSRGFTIAQMIAHILRYPMNAATYTSAPAPMGS